MMTPDEYAAKLDGKRERLERASERAAQGATDAYQRARAATEGIVFGQPILVGHHSEGRHRNALKRSDNAMRKSCELSAASEDFARRAESVGMGGISSDDPEAVEKLDDKRTDLEQRRDAMKRVNAYFKKHKTLDGCEESPELLADAACNRRCWNGGAPFPAYALTNLGARIRDAAKRAATIERTAAIPASASVVGLCTLTIDPSENRVLMAFPSRLARDDYKRVRSAGFVWAPSKNAFVRTLSTNAIWSAKDVASRITTLEG